MLSNKRSTYQVSHGITRNARLGHGQLGQVGQFGQVGQVGQFGQLGQLGQLGKCLTVTNEYYSISYNCKRFYCACPRLKLSFWCKKISFIQKKILCRSL
jgi:hypothetical protein